MFLAENILKVFDSYGKSTNISYICYKEDREKENELKKKRGSENRGHSNVGLRFRVIACNLGMQL